MPGDPAVSSGAAVVLPGFLRRRILGWPLLLGVLLADQASKWLAYLFSEIEIFGFIKISVTNNDQASFSLKVSNGTSIALALFWLLMMIPLVFLAHTRLTRLGLWLMIGGGVSNLTDRVVVGAVRDIITVHQAFFNVADGAIVAGALLVVISLLKQHYPKGR